MVRDPLSQLDALVVALSGFVIVFLMLALLWGIILVISRAVSGMEHHRFLLWPHPCLRLHRHGCLHRQRRRLCWKALTRRKQPASWRL